ncbi:MAG: sodium:calcium antiporter [bacterium]
MEIILSLIYLFLILFLIVGACVLFTNAIEHLGKEFNLSEGAVGSVLAAVGTALPETIVPLVAIIGAYITGANIETGKEIGIGAILGAPFMLGTLAFFVTGAAVLHYTRVNRRTSDMPVNTIIMFRDIHYFVLAYSIAIISSFIPFFLVKCFIAVLLIIIYTIYVIKTIRTASKISDNEEELEALYFTKHLNFPGAFHVPAIFLQVFLALIGIIFLAHIFVEQLKFLSEVFRINPLILSLIITPIATELPEKFNSIIWIRAKKDTLAMGNITGAMVFQSCIPTAIGLVLTPWILGVEALVNVVIVYLSVLVVYLNVLSNKGILKPSALLSGGLFYLFYLAYILFKINIIS